MLKESLNSREPNLQVKLYSVHSICLYEFHFYFRQTVLKKLERSIVPLFAGILSQIDAGSNCSLLDSRSEAELWQRDLFLTLFRSKDLVIFFPSKYCAEA